MTNAEKWIQWNVRRLALTDAEVRKFRAAGMRLWRERSASGLDPATGEPRFDVQRFDVQRYVLVKNRKRRKAKQLDTTESTK